MSNLVAKRFMEIDQKTITRFRDPLVAREWKTELVRTVTHLTLPFVSAVLGVEQKRNFGR